MSGDLPVIPDDYTVQSRTLGFALAGLLALGTLGSLGACDDTVDDAFKRKNAPDPSAPQCTEVGAQYVGFAGTKLEEKRVNAAIGADRARIKPYSALKGEYERTLGKAPSNIETAAASFGNPPERFSSEPRASAIQVYSSFRVAFEGCLVYTETGADYGVTPTPENAKTQCTRMARAFWSRVPTEDEVKQCTEVAVKDSATEIASRRRWAYVCASLLSSAGFLTY